MLKSCLLSLCEFVVFVSVFKDKDMYRSVPKRTFWPALSLSCHKTSCLNVWIEIDKWSCDDSSIQWANNPVLFSGYNEKRTCLNKDRRSIQREKKNISGWRHHIKPTKFQGKWEPLTISLPWNAKKSAFSPSVPGSSVRFEKTTIHKGGNWRARRKLAGTQGVYTDRKPSSVTWNRRIRSCERKR